MAGKDGKKTRRQSLWGHTTIGGGFLLSDFTDDMPSSAGQILMTGKESAILRTILYADIFQHAPTVQQCHEFLLTSAPCAYETFLATLNSSTDLRSALARRNGCLAIVGRECLFELRQQRDQDAAGLWRRARRGMRYFAALPFVRMVAVSGALAMNSPRSTLDDVDLLLVTRPGRVWIVRTVCVQLVRALNLSGVRFCPNYLLSEDALVQRRRDLFTAHEVAHLIPMAGWHTYRRFCLANEWVSGFLPNVRLPRQAGLQCGDARDGLVARAVSRLLGGRAGDALDRWRERRERRWLPPEPGRSDPAAELGRHVLKGHFDDHGSGILREYAARLKRFGLEDHTA